MKDASDSQPLRDLYEHRRVFNVENLLNGSLCDVERQPKDIHIGFTQVDEAGRNKEIDNRIEFKLLYSIGIQLTRSFREMESIALS